jgi:hypothetical protein
MTGIVRIHPAELFVYTARRDWYEERGWSLLQAGRDGRLVVLVRRLRAG